MLNQVTLGKGGMMRAVFLMCLVAAIVGCRRKSSDANPEIGAPAKWNEETEKEKPESDKRDEPIPSQVVRDGFSSIYFDFDVSRIRTDQMDRMDVNIKNYKRQTDASILLEGHADERGTTEYNMHLGERRALAVKEYLVRVGGIAAERIQIISKGEEDPEDVGHSEEAWAKNRRVEFYKVN